MSNKENYSSGALRSRFPQELVKASKAKLTHTFKASGRVILAPTESRLAMARVRRADGILADARAQREQSKAELVKAMAALENKRKLMRDKSSGVTAYTPILKGKDGSLYVQPRPNGKFGKRIVVG